MIDVRVRNWQAAMNDTRLRHASANKGYLIWQWYAIEFHCRSITYSHVEDFQIGWDGVGEGNSCHISFVIFEYHLLIFRVRAFLFSNLYSLQAVFMFVVLSWSYQSQYSINSTIYHVHVMLLTILHEFPLWRKLALQTTARYIVSVFIRASWISFPTPSAFFLECLAWDRPTHWSVGNRATVPSTFFKIKRI